MSSHNVETANKFIKTCNAHAELLFCLMNLYQENMQMRPCLYIEKNFPGVTLPALVNLRSDSLALTELTRLGRSRVCLEKGWLNWEGDLIIKKGLYPSPVFVSSVMKGKVSVRKCRKCWLAQGSSGRRVTLQPGVTFLHIRGRPYSSWKTSRYWLGKQYEQTKFGPVSRKFR